MTRRNLTVDVVLEALRRNHFAVLSTVGSDGTPHSAGVNYGVSPTGSPLALYIMTRRHLQKARDIDGNARISVVVPVKGRLAWLLPPATIQLRGQAELLNAVDQSGR